MIKTFWAAPGAVGANSSEWRAARPRGSSLMRRRTLAATTVAVAMTCAGAASATIVTAHEYGAYTVATGPVPAYYCGQCQGEGDHRTVFSSSPLGYFHGDFTFDTDLGVRTTTASADTITWNTAMGTPSPLVSGTWTITGLAQASPDLSTATSITLRRDSAGFNYSFVGAGYSISSSLHGPFGGPEPYSLEEAFALAPFPNSSVQNDGAYSDATWYAQSFYTYQSTLTPQLAAVPEPATWAMLILGFAGVGTGLRRARRSASVSSRRHLQAWVNVR